MRGDGRVCVYDARCVICWRKDLFAEAVVRVVLVLEKTFAHAQLRVVCFRGRIPVMRHMRAGPENSTWVEPDSGGPSGGVVMGYYPKQA